MAGRLTNESERNIRADEFLQEGKPDFAGNAFATAQINLLKTKITETGDFYKQQISNDGGIRQNYDIAAQADADLKLALREIADFTSTMDDVIEGIEEKFRFPRTGGKRGRIARARAFAVDVAPYEGTLIERGLDSDFIENLTTTADRLENAIRAAASNTTSRVGSTESKLQAHKDANKIITTLDPIVRKRYRDNPAKLAAWQSATHIRRNDKPKPEPENK